MKLSKRIQAEIKALDRQRHHDRKRGNRRRLSYGDVLVLVRRRGNLFDAVIQALKHAGIPVAGADRLKLTEHIAIIDLMNLADALLLPQDDLALAVALKSPLFGLDEDDLFALAWDRKGSLRDALTAHAADKRQIQGRARRGSTSANGASAHETPFAFYAWLLGGDGGRARILRRLGHEANDALDEFLELALAYETQGAGLAAGLHGLAARRRHRGEARHGNLARRGARDDRAWRQGTGSSGRIPGRHHDVAADTQRLSLIRLPQRQCGAEARMVWAGSKADDPRRVRRRARRRCWTRPSTNIAVCSMWR